MRMIARMPSTEELPGVMQLEEQAIPRDRPHDRAVPAPDGRDPVDRARGAAEVELTGFLLLLLGVGAVRLLPRGGGRKPVRTRGMQQREGARNRRRGRYVVEEVGQTSE